MDHIYSFEKLAVWQSTRQVVKKIYFLTRDFPKSEQFGITAQLRRACISICCNLAEGSGRWSEREKIRFYEIAFGSALEVVNLLIISNDLEYLPDADYQSIRKEIHAITYQINRLAKRNAPLDTTDSGAPNFPSQE